MLLPVAHFVLSVATCRAGPGRANTLGLRDGVADLEWIPKPGGDQLVLCSQATKCARVTVDGTTVGLERPGEETWTMPYRGGSVRVIVDGPVLEISTRDGILGGAIEPADIMQPVGRTCSVWSLDLTLATRP